MNNKKIYLPVEIEIVTFDTENLIFMSGESNSAKDPYELDED